MSNSNCINLLLLSKRHKISKTNLINLLKNIELLDGNGKTLKSNSKFVIIDKENVLINEKYFYNEIIHTNNFSNLALTLNNNIPIHEIKDNIVRLKKLNEASKKRLLFLDFEFVSNQYYEVAFQIIENGKLIQKGYFFEEKALEQQFISENGFYNCINKIVTKTNQLKMNKKNINDIVFFLNFEIKKTSMKLTDILDFFELKIDPSKLHYAYYDVEILKIVFFNIVDYFNKKY